MPDEISTFNQDLMLHFYRVLQAKSPLVRTPRGTLVKGFRINVQPQRIAGKYTAPVKGIQVQVEGNSTLGVKSVAYKASTDDDVPPLVEKVTARVRLLEEQQEAYEKERDRLRSEQAGKDSLKLQYTQLLGRLGIEPRKLSVGSGGEVQELHFVLGDARKVFGILRDHIEGGS